MKIQKYKNKAISLLLCVVLSIGVLPISVFASLSQHVKKLDIKLEEGGKHPLYPIRIEWKNPIFGTEKPDGLKILGRNASSNGKFEEVKGGIGIDKETAKIEETLENGSLYEYKVIPYRIIAGQNGKPPKEETPNLETAKTALFMTDIRVDVKGYGNTLEVTFDNPLYDGASLFDGYNIYYAKGGASVEKFDGDPVTISINNTDLVPSKDENGINRLTYKLTSENIKPGSIYAVKVEPVVSKGDILREKNVNTILIDNKPTKISYSKKELEYRTNDGHVAIPLYITEDNGKYIKLNWGDLTGINSVVAINNIEILASPSPDGPFDVMGVVYDDNITSYRLIKPTKKTYYKLKITFQKDADKPHIKDMYSIVAMYNPSEVNLTPNMPKIYPKNNVENNVSTIDLYWDTFIRPPYNEEEEKLAENGLYFDTNVHYDVYVSDSMKNLNKLGIPKILDKELAKNIETTKIDESENDVFKYKLEEYYTVDTNGDFKEKRIEENKTYYIKIVATKPTTDGLGLSAKPSYAQIYVPARGDISIPKSLSKPPLRVKKDENGIDKITTTSIDIKWNTRWYEIYDKSTDSWYTKATVENGKILFKEDVKDESKIIKFYDMDTKDEIKNAFKNAGYVDYDSLTIRNMDLSSPDIKYELIVESFDEINTNGGYKKYIEELLASNSDKWKSISPNIINKKYAEHSITNLEENTRYAILLRPYKMLTETRKEAYPTYILATTLPKDVDIEVMPVTPTLKAVEKTDTSVLVEWEETTVSNDYELAFDEVLVDDPANAKNTISSEEIKENGTFITKDDISYKRYDIKPLFPDTGYYVWLRSISQNGNKKSSWSNPIYVKTDKLAKPNAPNGLGLASQKSLDVYNASNDTKYVPSTGKYLVVEWLRDSNDRAKETKAEVKDTAEPLLDEKIKSTYMIKFNELIANTYYYTRAKTKITVTKSDKGIEKEYSYIVNLSINPDFTDAVSIEVPNVKDAEGSISVESDWTNVYKFKTEMVYPPDVDFDGNIIDDLYPLPSEDFEIIYDAQTNTLIYKFRTNKVDINGNADNLVDQRFITNLINNKTYNYNIDLTHYFGNSIKNRRVELPYTIISAFNNRKISLTITAGNTKFTLNPNFLNTKEVKSLGNMNRDTVVAINIEEIKNTLPTLNYNESYATTPQTLSITVQNNGKYKNLTHTGSFIDIQLKLKNRSLMIENNVGTYRNINNGKWERIPSIYNNETGICAVKTNRLGSYTNISNSVRENFSDMTNLVNVNEKIMFTDFKATDLSEPISVVGLNNIISGIANNKKEIAINGGLSTKDAKALKRTGMLLTGAVVRRDFGINTLVKLYELKTKAMYEPTDTLATTPYKDIKNANKMYQKNLIKAGELGFITNETSISPSELLSINDALYMINIILNDSGY